LYRRTPGVTSSAFWWGKTEGRSFKKAKNDSFKMTKKAFLILVRVKPTDGRIEDWIPYL
jgi:hypothetical protein